MSWKGYLKWLKDQIENIEKAEREDNTWEVERIAEAVLFSLSATEKLAKEKNCIEKWGEIKEFFIRKLSEIEEVRKKTFYSFLSSDHIEEDEYLEEGLELYKQKKYQEAVDILLPIYEKGKKNNPLLIKAISDCLDKTNQLLKLVDFLTDVIHSGYVSSQDKGELYNLLGKTYLKLGQNSQAKEAFWWAKRFLPQRKEIDENLLKIDGEKLKPKGKFSLLIEKGKLTQEELEKAKKEAISKKEDIEDVLMKMYNISKEDIGEALSAFYNVPFESFNPNLDPPYNIFERKKLNPDYLKRYGWVPLKEEGNKIIVLMQNPYDFTRLDEIKFILGTNFIEPRVGLKRDIEAYIDKFFRELKGEDELIKFDEVISEDKEREEIEEYEDAFSEQDSEIVRLVNAILVEAWRKGASDIHIEPNSRSRYLLIRFRVDGACHEFRRLKFALGRPIVSRIKIMAKMDIAERRLPQDGKIKLKIPDLNKVVEYRVVTVPTIDNQEDVVLRVLASGKPMPLEKLGMSKRNKEMFQQIITQPYGLILVVGPTGSGKTTTLHSALNYINTPDKKIWTAEDPVEITQEGLRQVQINPKIGLNFAAILRSFLRADPDVIMIGEMRDKETAHIGIEASLTGHLVFSTLHTNSAPETVTRLLDMDVDPFNFADSLLCVLAQRLVRTLCDNCKEAYKPSDLELEELKNEFGPEWEKFFPEEFLNDPVLYRPKGCNRCMDGYRGRIGIHELLINSENIKKLIKFKKPTEEIRDVAIKEGMLTLKQDGILKVINGITTINQVRSVARA